MKHLKGILALVLALVLALSCTVGAFADGSPVSSSAAEKVSQAKTGFESERFKLENTYRYADNETVRAIVILKSAPLADVGGGTYGTASVNSLSGEAAAYSAQLQREHTQVRSAMSREKISYKVVYEFTTLLNGFSCDVAYGDLEKIAELPNVDAVYIANQYSIPEDTVITSADNFNGQTGNAITHSNGWAGQGTVIAVLDSGFNLDHAAFQVYGSQMAEARLSRDDIGAAVASGQYVSAKVPFAYDYADGDDNVFELLNDATGGHGTHVAAIALGYAEASNGEDTTVTFEGAAPKAQLLAMKIFSDESSTTSSDVYFYALEDAYRLGADVINMSIGSPCGFTYDTSLETEVFGNIYARLENAGIVVCTSAGNSGSMATHASKGFISPDYTDYGMVGSPSSYRETVSVASMEAATYPAYFISFGESGFTYVDTCDDGEHGWLDVLGGTDKDYVVLTNTVTDAETGESATSMAMGNPEDYYAKDEDGNVTEASLVEGKIAVVSRGSITFEEKVENAANAGAIACLVVNNAPGDVSSGMAIETYEIPAVLIPYEAGEVLLAALTGTVTTEDEPKSTANPDGGTMSDFSSWGTTPELTLKPTITSVGGDVWAADYSNDSGYVLMSGTSMASPNMAGTFASVLSFLRSGDAMSKGEAAETAKSLLESAAELVYDEYGDYYSVRKQGSGLGRSDNAIAAYQNGAYIADPLKELGDDAGMTGVYSFDVTLVNGTESDITYVPEATVMTDYIAQDAYGDILNTLYTDDITGSAEVSYTVDGMEADTVTVPAGGSVTVSVTIVLAEDATAYLSEVFENGAFIEGYVEFKSEGVQPIHATYLGYYGDWTSAPVLEQADFQDILFYNYWLYENYYNWYASYLYSGYDADDIMGLTTTSYNKAYVINANYYGILAGDSLLSGYYDSDSGLITEFVPFDEENISLSTGESDADYLYYDLLYLVPFQLRNAKSLTLNITDAEDGTLYYTETDRYIPKAPYDSIRGVWQSYVSYLWDGTDSNGDYLPDGTKVHVQFDAVLPYGDTVQEDCWSFDLTIDSKAPEVSSAVYDEENGTLTVTATDNHALSAIYLADDYGNILDAVAIGGGTEAEVVFNVSDVASYSDHVNVCVLDYATNERDELAYFFDVGADATITLVSPAGTTKIPVKTGDTFTFPACEDETAEDAEFLFWNSLPIEDHLDADGWDIYSYLWYPYTFYAGDSFTVTGDVTLYAVYQVGTYAELDTPVYTYYQRSDYSGDWAIVGQPYVSGYRYDDPYVLDENADATPIKAIDENVDLSNADYNEFASSADGFRFTFTKQSDGSYTVRNTKTGKYLAYENGSLTMADTASIAARWFVVTAENGLGSLMSNAANTDKHLLFNDDDSLKFEMMDDATPLITYAGRDYYPSDLYILWLYKYTTTELVPEYYTTDVSPRGSSVIVIPPAPGDEPTTPDEPAEPDEPIAPAPECHWDTFTDCTADWYHEAVDFMVSNGLMLGVGDSLFAPDDSLTRAMVATVLYRSAGSPAVSSASSFADVEDGLWYSDAVAWAQESRVINGVSDDAFAPMASATREQIITILWRYAGSPKADADLSAYLDAGEISGYASDAMAWAVSSGILQGDSGLLRPSAEASRAEFSCIMMRYLGGSYDCGSID